MNVQLSEAREYVENVYPAIKAGRASEGTRRRYRAMLAVITERQEDRYDDPTLTAAFHPDEDSAWTEHRFTETAPPSLSVHTTPLTEAVQDALSEWLTLEDEAHNPSPEYDPELDRDAERDALRSRADAIRRDLRKRYALAKKGNGPRISSEEWSATEREADRLDALADQIPTYKSAFRYSQVEMTSRRQRRKATEAATIAGARSAVEFADLIGQHVVDAMRELDDTDELLDTPVTVLVDDPADPVAVADAVEAKRLYRAARVAAAIAEYGGFGATARALHSGVPMDPDVAEYVTSRWDVPLHRHVAEFDVYVRIRSSAPSLSRRLRRRGPSEARRPLSTDPSSLVIVRQYGHNEVGLVPGEGRRLDTCPTDPDRIGWEAEGTRARDVAKDVRRLQHRPRVHRRTVVCGWGLAAMLDAVQDFALTSSEVWLPVPAPYNRVQPTTTYRPLFSKGT